MIRYYVYIHYTQNEIPFYVGKGHGSRYKVGGTRNSDYKKIIENNGKDNIRIEIIPCGSEQAAILLEIKIIEEYLSKGVKLANIMPKGWSNSGWHHAEETKRKISLSQPMLGKKFKHTPEAIEKIRRAGRGRKLSAEHKKALVLSLMGHPYRAPKTIEALIRQKTARLGKKNSLEHNAKISATKKKKN